MSVDNDPDSRPPCRLLHVVPGGDYGYRFRYGRSGLHPFVAWNGELPGTLPMASATGELPSGLVAYESDDLPAEYRGEMFGTSWGDHRVDRFIPSEHGATVWAKMEPLVTGGADFRPVGIAVAPDGSLYVTDWVDKSYSVHGKGRIWHIHAVEPKKVDRPSDDRDAIHSADRTGRSEAARRLAADTSHGRQLLRQLALHDANVRTRATAISALADVADGETDFQAIALGDPSIEVCALAVRSMPAAILNAANVAKLIGGDQPAAVRRSVAARYDCLDARRGAGGADVDDPFLQQAARRGARQHGFRIDPHRSGQIADSATTARADACFARPTSRRDESCCRNCWTIPIRRFGSRQSNGSAKSM